MASFLKLIHAICDITKIGKEELNGRHWPKTWSSDAPATTAALLSKRWKTQMPNGVPPEYEIDV